MIEPADLDVAWFQAALMPRYPGVQVAATHVTHVDEVTNTHVRVTLAYDEAAGAPEKVFVKLPPLDPERRAAIGATGMGKREARFYDLLAPHVDLRVPVAHAVVMEDDGGFAIAVEDLDTSGCTTSDGTVSVTPDAAAVAIGELAAMHVRYEDPARRTGPEVSWVKAPGPGGEYGAKLLRRGVDRYPEKLNAAYIAVAERYIADRQTLHALWEDAPPTVIHGDAHLGNLFFDAGRVGFLDWGIITLADPLRDISYFIAMGLSVDDRRAHERDLLQHYLDVRRSLGGRDIGWDEAWHRHRVQAAYTVPASCQAIEVPDSADDRRRVFAAAFLARAVAVVEDLESPAVLP